MIAKCIVVGQMSQKVAGLSIVFSLLAACATQLGESQEIVDNLVEAGFPVDDIMIVDGVVYVGRDAEVSLEASREMLDVGDPAEEQYRTNNLNILALVGDQRNLAT